MQLEDWEKNLVKDIAYRIETDAYRKLPKNGLEQMSHDLQNLLDLAERRLPIYLPKGEKVLLTNGGAITKDFAKINPETGMQEAYLILSETERLQGFIRPVRRTYTHKVCGSETTMAAAIAETYARDPKFYNGTFCVKCRSHHPLNQFVWSGTNEEVGS